MAIPVRCTGCGSAMKVADQYAGKKGKCPKCGCVVQVPKVARAMAPQQPAAVNPLAAKAPNPTPTAAPAATPFRSPLSPVRPAPTGNKLSLPPPWVWVAGSGGVAVIVLLLVGFVRNDNYDSTPAQKTIASGPNPAAGNAAPEKSMSPATKSASNRHSSPAPSFVPASASADMLPGGEQGKIAKTLDEVNNALVKFEMPLPNGRMISGAGFLIDRRGWVATNNHVASMASTAARVRTFSSQRFEIEGIIAVEPKWDLAIVKLKDAPSDLTLLDISYRDRPNVGTTVYAYGHPENLDFTASRGIVSRVLTTGELISEQSGDIGSVIPAPADHLWIQTDAKINPGSSGGPLVDDDCRVIGVNTFLNVKAMYGFASHVKYLKELADTASGKVTPLKKPSEIEPPMQDDLGSKPGEPMKIAISKDKLQRTFDTAAAFDWKPAKAGDYNLMADLALMMTACKESNVPFHLSDLTDRLFEKLRSVSWSNEHIVAINRYAADKLSAPGRGAVFVGRVVHTMSNKSGEVSAIVLEVSGVSDLFMVPIDPHSLTPSLGTRQLVFGVILPQTATAVTSNNSEERTVRIIRSHHVLSVM